MAKQTDLQLTYDINPFIKAMKRVKREMSDMAQTAGAYARHAGYKIKQFYKNWRQRSKENGKTIKQSMMTAGESVKALTRRVAVLGAGFLAIKGAMSKIPELGQAFSIAGDIALRNFLEPLRQFLIPMLMDMITWVRNNKATITKWGTAFANAFRTIIVLVKQAFQLIKTFVKSLTDSVGGIFKDIAQDTTKTLNMIIFKISAIFIFLGELLKPVFANLGRIIGGILKLVMAFAKGVLKYITPIFQTISGIVQDIADFFTTLTDKTAKASGVLKFFEVIGNIVGGVILTAFRALRAVISVVLGALKGFIDGIVQGLGGKDGLTKIQEVLKGVFDFLGKVFEFVKNKIVPVFSGAFKVVATVIGNILRGVMTVIRGIIDGISWIIRNIGKVADFVKKIYGTDISDRIKKLQQQQSADMTGATAIPGVQARANGGPISPQRPYIVGEKGPELIVPSSAGTVIPTGQTMAAAGKTITVGGITMNFNITGGGNAVQTADTIKDRLNDAIMNVFNKLEQAEA